MTIEQLMKLRNSNEAPYEHAAYTVWLHNQILDSINYDLWNFRERESGKYKSTYAIMTNLSNLPTFKTIK